MTSAVVSSDPSITLTVPKRSKALSAKTWAAWVSHINTPAFIETDPIRYPHAYLGLNDWRHAELVSFLAAMMSYGNRTAIFKLLDPLTQRLGPHPLDTLMTSTPASRQQLCDGLYYRFFTQTDLATILGCLAHAYERWESLGDLWQQCYELSPDTEPGADLALGIHRFRQQFFSPLQEPLSYGTGFFLADPLKRGAAKRFNMWLRWLARQDHVDMGLWSDIMPSAELVMPIDTHVAKTARFCCITDRRANDWKTAVAITQYFKTLAPDDPVQYDFALFGIGQQL